MLSVNLTTLESILLLAVGWVFIWWASALIHAQFIEQDRSNAQSLLADPVYYEYFCSNGHYLGRQEPPPGKLCEMCLTRGYIRAVCYRDGVEHEARFVNNTPPYQIACPKHGTHTASYFTRGNRQITQSEWLELNRARFLPTPLPVLDPLPAYLIPWARDNGVSLQLQPPVQRRIKNLERVLEDRLQAIPALIARRHRTARMVTIGGIVLGVLLLLLICVLLSTPVNLLFNPAVVLSEFPSTALWASKVLFSIISVFLPLLYLLTRRESAARPVPRQEIRLSLLLAELFVLVALPLLFRGRVNPFEVMLGLALVIVVEVMAGAFERHHDIKDLQQQEAHFRDELRDVQASLKNIAEATVFVSERDKEIAAPPPEPTPDPATSGKYALQMTSSTPART